MKKTIRTSNQYSRSFVLLDEVMIENESNVPWFLYRSALKTALKSNLPTIVVGLMDRLEHTRKTTPTVIRGKVAFVEDKDYRNGGDDYDLYDITHGTTQRGKKFIKIGCKRFVGDNRRALIQWAKSGK